MDHKSDIGFCRWLVLLTLPFVILICFKTRGQTVESFAGFMTGIRANAVEGKVYYQRNDGKFDLEPGIKLEEGDFIRSDENAYAEVLLQPGNYLRLAGETECQILCDEHDKMRLRLNYGTANLEILARDFASSFYYVPEQATELIRVITPNGDVFIARPGIFRVDVSPGRTELVVRDGDAALVGHRVKEKRRAQSVNGNVTISEIDSKVEDKFDSWAHERAKAMVQANKLLKQEEPWANRKEGEEPEVDVPDEEDDSENRGLVISARPGAVNFVEDGAEVSHGSDPWQQLTEKSQLEVGDKVRTQPYSFVELALLPDIHLRLDQESELELAQLSNDEISLKLLRGSAVLDVVRFDQKQLPKITIGGASNSVVIADDGNYRVDAARASAAITVRRGKVIFNGRSVGSCRIIAAGDISGCDKRRTDNLDFWSHYRGEGELYSAPTTVSMVSHLARQRRRSFRNTGFWFQQPGQTSYTFVPFHSKLFRSPYGGNYTTVLAPRRMSMPRIDLRRRPSSRLPGPEDARPRPR